MSDEHQRVLDPTSAPRRASEVHTVELDGEAVLLDERANELHVLNHTATLLWQLYDGVITLDELASEIADSIGLDPGIARADILEATGQMARSGLVEQCRWLDEFEELDEKVDP
jgi:hypothetical protein